MLKFFVTTTEIVTTYIREVKDGNYRKLNHLFPNNKIKIFKSLNSVVLEGI